jgi:hypothetical protein
MSLVHARTPQIQHLQVASLRSTCPNAESLVRNDRTFPATNFQFVPVRIFEKTGVIAAAVAATDLRALQTSSADFAHEPGEPINFFTGLSPKSDPRAVGPMPSILREAEKRFRLLFAGRIECSPPSARAIAGKTERWQQLAVKLVRALQITDAQINMVEISCFFHFGFAGFRFAWVATPDHLPLITTPSSLSPRGPVVRELVVLLTGNDWTLPATDF